MAVEYIIILCAVLYWTTAVVFLTLCVVEGDVSRYDMLALSVFWPFTAVFAIIAVTYRMCLRSSAAIRQDLKNKGLLEDFYKFLDEKEGE